MDDGSPPAYCPNCGDGVGESMNFCPNCGTATSAETPVADDRRKLTDRDVLEHRIRLARDEGWDLEHDSGDRAVLIKRSFGGAVAHVGIAIFTLTWTMGLGNILYAGYSYFGNVTRTIVDADGPVESTDRPSLTTGEWVVGTIVALVLWGFAAMLTSVGLLLWAISGWAALVAAVFLLAFVFGLAGFTTFPPSKRRLADRGPVSRHGRIRETDERRIVDPGATCTECGGAVGDGLECTYRDELVLFGFTLRSSEGTNRYCGRCVETEHRYTAPTADEQPRGSRPDGEGPGTDHDVRLERS